jgi:hypothetical protein
VEPGRMSEGKEPNQSPTITALASTTVITIGSVYESQDIIHAIVQILSSFAPTAATQPVATMAFVSFIALLIVILYALKRHFDHLVSGRYAAPTRRRPPPKKRAKKGRR